MTSSGRRGAWRRTEMTDPTGATDGGPWPYLGVGCLTLVAGFFGGGMIALMVAKIVGVAQSCPAETETGAPCNWFSYLVIGASIGAVLLPSVALWRMRRGRMKERHNA
jgi:hypothetical protein